MSYTKIFGFGKSGKAFLAGETQNSWRGAIAIWSALEEKYLPPHIPNYAKAANWYYDGISFEKVTTRLTYKPSRITDMFSPDAMQEILDLSDSPEVSETDRICLDTTFDHVLVKREDMPKVIAAFKSFEGETSLPEQAAVLERLWADENCIAVGWNQTSVGSETWCNANYDEETGEYSPYNCLKQTKHWWLFHN